MKLSTYTTTMKQAIDNNFPLTWQENYPIFDELNELNEVQKSMLHMLLAGYETYRQKLNDKIYNHYKFTEIEFETLAMFDDRMTCKLREIMDYYNQLYMTCLIDFNPLFTKFYKEQYTGKTASTGVKETGDSTSNKQDVDSTSKANENKASTQNGSATSSTDGTSQGESDGKTTSTASTINNGRQADADTSENLVSQGMSGSIDSQIGMSKFSVSKSDSNTNGGGTSESTSKNTSSSSTNNASHTKATDVASKDSTDHTRTVGDTTHKQSMATADEGINDYIKIQEGYDGQVPSDLLKAFRDSLLNIDMMIIKDLECMFIGLW